VSVSLGVVTKPLCHVLLYFTRHGHEKKVSASGPRYAVRRLPSGHSTLRTYQGCWKCALPRHVVGPMVRNVTE
jgi:hypothetical protein